MSPEDQILSLVRENYQKVGNPVDYVQSIVKPLALEQLRTAMQQCNACPIAANKTRTFFKGTGYEPVMMISNHPLDAQAGSGITYPFDGSEEERILSILLNYYHVDRKKLCWMNLVNCFPTVQAEGVNIPESRPLKLSEIRMCRGFLEYAVRIVQPRFLILFGNEVLNHFNIVTLNKAHGKRFEFMGVSCMPVPDVSRVVIAMHDKDMLPEEIEEKKLGLQIDLGKAFALANELFPEEHILTEASGEEKKGD